MHDYIAFDPSRAKSSVNRALPEPFPIQLDRGEMAGLLTRLPAAISQSLTPQQIDGLYSALRTLHETKHAIDFRVSLPFFRKRYYRAPRKIPLDRRSRI